MFVQRHCSTAVNERLVRLTNCALQDTAARGARRACRGRPARRGRRALLVRACVVVWPSWFARASPSTTRKRLLQSRTDGRSLVHRYMLVHPRVHPR